MPQVFEEFTEITLSRSVDVQGMHMPAGARGVIMAAWADGRAYEVEFETPRHVVLTIEDADLRK
jgi:hypothetical protein